ncbi:Glycosyl hydrolase family 109 protein 3 [Frankliniella fusca]|uniref:Glycosyl hydrolase family 109 protein 3 n=1 Tax=Frankliniella fusca TaxID=407009 RepID=A0AAE1GXW2_9NEOP|nr:Glycosyl hydrolase family 109 protein 3 [Frankliniella fusca]
MSGRRAPLPLLVLAVLAAVQLDGVSPARHKRYLHFPYGTTLRVAFSSKWSTIFDWPNSPAFWTENVNWGLTYELPNGTQLLGPAGFSARRDRRDLYRRLETAIDSTGLVGRECMLRSICEAPQFLVPGDNLIAELLRVLLRFIPADGRANSGPYDSAQHAGARGLDCQHLYRDCPVSLLGLLLSLRQT